MIHAHMRPFLDISTALISIRGAPWLVCHWLTIYEHWLFHCDFNLDFTGITRENYFFDIYNSSESYEISI